MYVHRRKLYSVVQLVLDALSFWVVWGVSAQLRVILNPLMKLQLTWIDSAGWVPPMLVVLLLWLPVSWRLRLYRPPFEVRPLAVLNSAGRNAVAITSLTVLSVFFSRQVGEGASRMFVACLLPSTFVVFTLTRVVALTVFAVVKSWRKPPCIALIGDAASAAQFISRSELKMRSAIRGLIIPEAAAAAAAGLFAPVRGATAHAVEFGQNETAATLPVLGTTRQIAELVNKEQIERVIVLNGSLSAAELERCHKIFWRMGLPVSRTLDLAFTAAPVPLRGFRPRVNFSEHEGLSMVEVRPAPFLRRQDYLKHALDYGVAIILLVILWPVLLLISVLIRMTSQGPALDRLPRVGKGGRHFTCFKFRSTYREGDPVSATTAKRRTTFDQDEYLTPIGAFLRRYTLDELPQLINIVRGEMSFVGPRPLPAQDFGPDGMSRDFFDWSEARARVRPGLTGLWQVSGRRNLSFDEMIHLDIEYIQIRSLWQDLRILIRTPVPVLRGTGAR